METKPSTKIMQWTVGIILTLCIAVGILNLVFSSDSSSSNNPQQQSTENPF